MSTKNLILVTGATGQQGGATARHLLRQGWQVRGLTRNPQSSKAKALAESGAELVQGDLDDGPSLDAALAGAYGIFSFPNLSAGMEAEVRQGITVARAAQAAGVAHFVQGSVGGVERGSGIPHFESKWEVENAVRDLNLPATFLRPSFFMENFFWKQAQILNGTYESMGMRPEKTLQMIAADDIGAFAALVFNNPDEYIGQGIELAGDELTEPQIVAAFSQALAREVRLSPPSGPAPTEDLDRMNRWFDEEGYQANIPALRALLPDLQTLEDWLPRNGWHESA